MNSNRSLIDLGEGTGEEMRQIVTEYVVQNETDLREKYGNQLIAVNANRKVLGNSRDFHRLNARMAREDANVLIATIDEFKALYDLQQREEI